MIWGVLYFEKHRHGNSYWWLLINNYQCSYNAWLCKMNDISRSCFLMEAYGWLCLVIPAPHFRNKEYFERMNIYIYIKYVYICIYIRISLYVYIYIYLFVYIYIYVYLIYIYIYRYRYLFWKIFIFTFVCVYIIYIYTLICILRFIFLNIFTYLNILDHDDAQALICFIVVILMPAAIPCDAFYIKAIALNTPKIVGV